MSPDKIVKLCILAGVCLGLILLVVYLVYHQQKTTNDTQREITDRDLLRMLHNEPDQLLSPHQLRDKTKLTLNEARTRLNALFSYGILRRSYNSSGRHYFSPRDPVEEAPSMNLSSDPFLTVEDLLQIFAAHDYKVTAQQMIMATGLPLNVIKREMKYFEKEDILQLLRRTDSNGATYKRFYVLQDPYRSDPERFRAKAGTLDLEVRRILVDEKLLV